MANLTVGYACNSAVIPFPSLFGAKILALTANVVQNFSQDISDQEYYNHPSISVKGVNFCNITVTYTHPGQDDSINVEAWLPMDRWNGRLQASGGGGWTAGRLPLSYTAMAGAIGDGYAATTTDAGFGQNSFFPEPWALRSPGNVDLFALQNIASVSLNDQAVIGKALVSSFYGQPAEYSYFSGCSHGGRQALMLAQRYPDAYDGIAAAAPAINWVKLFPLMPVAQVMMNLQGDFLPACEFDAITNAAIKACDALDGDIDGVVIDSDACTFDPFTLVGTPIYCSQTGKNTTISYTAATVTNTTWSGLRGLAGEFLWHGLDNQARLTGAAGENGLPNDIGYATTYCTNGTCTGTPTGFGDRWLQLFVQKDPNWDYMKIKSLDELSKLFHASVQQYDSIIGTADADLSEFAKSGGKMITYHGLADSLIPSRGTNEYYNRVLKATSDTPSFYRYFQVPGLGHCAGGVGGQPTATWQALVDWVEKGITPNTLPISFTDTQGTKHSRILCPYPEKARLKAGAVDPKVADSWACTL